jgi:hypothetical protein
MHEKDFYETAHLIVSAVRLLEHQHALPPSIEMVSEALSFSLEQGNLLCRKLENFGVISVVEGAYGTRIFIKDHLRIEEIPRGEIGKRLDQELQKFQDSRKELTQKIESITAGHLARKKNLFAELEEKLKKNLEKK